MAVILLDIDRKLWRKMFNAARQGDQDAIEEFRQLWTEFEDLECFLCARPVPSDQCYSEPIAHRTDASLICAAPLCQECSGLPTLQRMHRVHRILGVMWRNRKTGSPMRFSYRMPFNR